MKINVELNPVKEAFRALAQSNTRIKLSQVKELSGVENPSAEIEVLKKSGIIVQTGPEEFMWV